MAVIHDPFSRDPYEPRFRNSSEEYEYMRQKWHEFQKELEYWRDAAKKNDADSQYIRQENRQYQRTIKILELALDIAVDDETKKAEILTKAKNSIDVLRMFEK